jgi:TRAP-type C4-dicarboxylate transport system permease large subunit
MILILMQLSVHPDGHVSRRHRHAGHRGAALCAAGRALGFDLIWYGVLYTITTQIAYMTPPFGYNLFLMRAMAPPEIGLRDIYRSIIPFVG